MIRPRTVLVACAAFLAVSCDDPVLAQEATTPEIVGDWHGTLDTPRGDITLVIYVERGEDGALKAQVENAFQAPGRMADIDQISVKDGHLSWKVDRINATYEGDWVPADQQWEGTFHQGADFPLALSMGQPKAWPVVEGLDGTWAGVAEVNSAKLRQVLSVTTLPKRGTVITFSQPDQMVFGVQVENFALDGQEVSFSLRHGEFTFKGELSGDRRQLSGTFTPKMGDHTLDVTLTRSDTVAAANAKPKRPQEPKPPFPYKAEEVGFDNPVFPEVHLAGTLTLPEGEGPFPAAVLITGSGPQNRDEELMGHKPFAVIADYLTRHGIAVLRYDDRGVGESRGDYAAATSADLATDANSAVALLKTRAEIRHDAIGVIGHSEGGMIGPIAAAHNPGIAFVVMLAGPGTHLDKLMTSQQRLIGMSMGRSQEQLEKQEPVMAAMFKAIAESKTPQEGKEAAKAVLTPEALAALGVPPDFDKDRVVARITTPWFMYFLKYDPAKNLSRIKVPILAMGGSLDLQVPADENLPAIAEATRENPDVEIVKLPGLNHLFQHAKTGGVGEYMTIEETFAPEALQLMGEWINQRFGKR